MRNLREINWWELVKAYKWLRTNGFLPEEMSCYNTVGQNKKAYCEILAYVLEKLTDEQLKEVPDNIKILYNFIFQDERKVFNLKSNESTYRLIVKNDEFGSGENTQASIINAMLKKGGYSLLSMAKAANTNIVRVKTHIFSLKKKFADKIEIVSVRKGRICVYYMKEKKNGKGSSHKESGVSTIS
jgi:mRNA-degrading endonuclease HigB of HigAB toxin-antitoxin module